MIAEYVYSIVRPELDVQWCIESQVQKRVRHSNLNINYSLHVLVIELWNIAFLHGITFLKMFLSFFSVFATERMEKLPISEFNNNARPQQILTMIMNICNESLPMTHDSTNYLVKERVFIVFKWNEWISAWLFFSSFLRRSCQNIMSFCFRNNLGFCRDVMCFSRQYW